MFPADTSDARELHPRIPALQIERPRIALSRADLLIREEGVTAKQKGYRTEVVEARFVLPDFVAQVQARTGLAKSTVARILLESRRLSEAVNNPQEFIERTGDLINGVKRELLVDGVEYLKVDGLVYEMRRFEDDGTFELFESNVHLVEEPEKTLSTKQRVQKWTPDFGREITQLLRVANGIILSRNRAFRLPQQPFSFGEPGTMNAEDRQDDGHETQISEIRRFINPLCSRRCRHESERLTFTRRENP